MYFRKLSNQFLLRDQTKHSSVNLLIASFIGCNVVIFLLVLLSVKSSSCDINFLPRNQNLNINVLKVKHNYIQLAISFLL